MDLYAGERPVTLQQRPTRSTGPTSYISPFQPTNPRASKGFVESCRVVSEATRARLSATRSQMAQAAGRSSHPRSFL
eukprot:5561251-Prymnesium_polylepis.1